MMKACIFFLLFCTLLWSRTNAGATCEVGLQLDIKTDLDSNSSESTHCVTHYNCEVNKSCINLRQFYFKVKAVYGKELESGCQLLNGIMSCYCTENDCNVESNMGHFYFTINGTNGLIDNRFSIFSSFIKQTTSEETPKKHIICKSDASIALKDVLLFDKEGDVYCMTSFVRQDDKCTKKMDVFRNSNEIAVKKSAKEECQVVSGESHNQTVLCFCKDLFCNADDHKIKTLLEPLANAMNMEGCWPDEETSNLGSQIGNLCIIAIVCFIHCFI